MGLVMLAQMRLAGEAELFEKSHGRHVAGVDFGGEFACRRAVFICVPQMRDESAGALAGDPLPLAVLAGDSLIIMGFQILARTAGLAPERALALIDILGTRTGMPFGICAGQGWESEEKIDLSAYHQAKTGALFIAATQMGAVAAGQEAEPWEELGARIGEAFQVADDLRDALCDEETLGKPAGQDDLHGRPNAVAAYGVQGAIQRFDDILGGAIASIPACPGEAALAQMVRAYADKLVPAGARGRSTVPGE